MQIPQTVLFDQYPYMGTYDAYGVEFIAYYDPAGEGEIVIVCPDVDAECGDQERLRAPACCAPDFDEIKNELHSYLCHTGFFDYLQCQHEKGAISKHYDRDDGVSFSRKDGPFVECCEVGVDFVTRFCNAGQ